jgi:hypothetical protein
MHVIAANVIAADIATEFDLSYTEASQFLNRMLEEDSSFDATFDADDDAPHAFDVDD